MLQKALHLVASGEATSSDQLARGLAVTPEVGRELLDQLVRLGYLRPAGVDCPKACAGCAQAGACLASARVWQLTDKGRRAASTF